MKCIICKKHRAKKPFQTAEVITMRCPACGFIRYNKVTKVLEVIKKGKVMRSENS